MNTSILDIRTLCAGYRTPVVRDISLMVDQGELVCILGPNGCGKTTLLRAISGSARIFSGTIHLGDRDAASLSLRERARRLALVSQQNPLCAGLRVWDVLCMGLYAARTPLTPLSANQRDILHQTAVDFGTETLLERDCGTLSAGQRQLVHLTRAAIQNTPLLLLDEPNSALDFENTHRYLTYLRHWIQKKKRGALLILHDPALALRYGDRILPMKAGAITGDLCPATADRTAIESALCPLYPSLRLQRMGDHWYTDIHDSTERNHHAAH